MKLLDPRLAALAARELGLVTTRAVAELAIPRAALRWAAASGHLVRVAHGGYVEAGVWKAADDRRRHVLRLRAVLARTPSGVATEQSAAVVLGLPLPAVPERVRVLVPWNGAGTPGVVHRRADVDTEEIVVREGVRVTAPDRTVVDCARHLDRPWALAVADAARRTASLSRQALRRAADRRPAAPGHDRALWVADHAITSAESPLESLGRAVTMLGGHPEPRSQVWVETRRGPFRVDLLDPGGRVVTEADGRSKYAAAEDLWQEKRREDALRETFEVVRFTYADYRHPALWLEVYRGALVRAYR